MRRVLVAAFGLLFAISLSTASAQTDLRLVTALKNQHATAARPLIRQRAGVNTPDVDGSTPLQWAAHWNDLDTVKALLAAGAKPNVANRYGVTPLHEAATIGSAAVVNALLGGGGEEKKT